VKNNQLIVNNRETGKTTHLFNEIVRLVKEGSNIIVLDSATEHEDKSLLRKVMNSFDNAVSIDIRDERMVALNQVSIQEFISKFMCFFPFQEVFNNRGKIICFDLSYFLERGHDIFDETNDRDKYNYYRGLYNLASQQIVASLIMMESCGIIGNSIVVMDEIELPIVDYDISLFQKDINFIASVHPENDFGTFYKSFEKLEFKAYRKRKD